VEPSGEEDGELAGVGKKQSGSRGGGARHRRRREKGEARGCALALSRDGSRERVAHGKCAI
jgi:hypothetical protein